MTEERRSERGFTVVEALVSISLFVALGFVTLALLRAMLGASASGATSRRWSADARANKSTNFAATPRPRSPSSCRRPTSCNDRTARTERLRTKSTSTRRPTPARRHIGRTISTPPQKRSSVSTNDSAGHRGEADRATGAIDTAAKYPILPGVSQFDARTLEANDLVGTNNVYASAVAPLFAAASPKSLPVGFDDGGPARTDLYGGNTTVQVQIATAHASRDRPSRERRDAERLHGPRVSAITRDRIPRRSNASLLVRSGRKVARLRQRATRHQLRQLADPSRPRRGATSISTVIPVA